MYFNFFIVTILKDIAFELHPNILDKQNFMIESRNASIYFKKVFLVLLCKVSYIQKHFQLSEIGVL